MRARTEVTLLGFLVVALVLTGCQTGGGSGDGAPRTKAPSYFGDVKLTRVDPSDPGGRTYTFTVENVTAPPRALEDLTARVLFYLPKTGGIDKRWDTELQERVFSLYTDNPSRKLEFKVRADADVQGWDFQIGQARTEEGSRFLDDQLVCTKVVNNMTGLKPGVEFVVESNKKLLGLEYQVVFLRRGEKVWNTPWIPIQGAIESGDPRTLTPDVAAAPPEARRAVTLFLKIRLSDL